MSEILLDYKRPDPTTWVYLSSFLTVGLFFVFRRFWSIRNLDIALLILLAPGLLVVHEGYRRELEELEAIAESRKATSELTSIDTDTARPLDVWVSAGPDDETVQPAEAGVTTDKIGAGGENGTGEETGTEGDPGTGGEETGASDEGSNASGESPDGEAVAPFTPLDIKRWGFIYLFIIEGLLFLRLMVDPVMVRRPLLDPNLTTGGLYFIGIWLFIFMMANVVTSSPRLQKTQGPELGPGYALMNMLPAIPTHSGRAFMGSVSPPDPGELTESQAQLARIAKGMAIIAHLAIVAGLVLIASRHFGNVRAGVGCATLYLMLPYTAQMTGRVDHALPAALLLWAVLFYRKPFVAGMFIGLAGGLLYYPLFLLPLWFSFYWQRGARTFAAGVGVMLVALAAALVFDDSTAVTEDLRRMFGILNPNRDAGELEGIWGLGWYPIWRLPVIVAFAILSAVFANWPGQKNLATLLSGSAALMLATQFWHGNGGGLYIAWFLPLLLLVIFRPNLQDRVAMKVVIGGPRPRVSDPGLELEAA